MLSAGNSFVIFSTVKYNAIKMDKASVWIIQNLATSDLLTNITVMIPVFISNIFGMSYLIFFVCLYPIFFVCYILITLLHDVKITQRIRLNRTIFASKDGISLNQSANSTKHFSIKMGLNDHHINKFLFYGYYSRMTKILYKKTEHNFDSLFCR